MAEVSGWKIAGLVIAAVAVAYAACVVAAILAAVKGGKLIEEAGAEWPD